MSEAIAHSSEVHIRRAKPRDIEAVAQLGLEALKAFAYPRMVVDPDKVRAVAREVVTGAGNFCMVAEQNGALVGAVSALVHEQLFYERRTASVVQFYSKVPRVGVRLIRIFLEWARARPGIKTIVFTVETQADPRIVRLLQRLGLTDSFPVLREVR